MLASHCKERYACEAFDYDDGRCNKAFFDTVCNTSASVGDKPSYPRRFSDMPGFEWFRDWPHAFNESCGHSATLTRLKSADGRFIDAKKHHRLRALCHLHTRCVREHPDQCSGAVGGECPGTAEARSRKAFVSEDMQTAFWTLGIAQVRHMFQYGGAVLLPAAIFMIFIVSSELSHVHASATQYWMCLEIAHQEHKRNGNHKSCRFKAGLYAARALLFLVRDCLVTMVLPPTIFSIVSVTTAFEIVFCGAIAIVLLQADQHLFSTMMTDARLEEISEEFSLVLTRQQCKRLEIEGSVVFWSALLWITVGYMGFVWYPVVLDPVYGRTNSFAIVANVGFALFPELITEAWCTCWERSKGIKTSTTQLPRRCARALLKKVAAYLFFWVIWNLLDTIFFQRNNAIQAAAGDIRYGFPDSETSRLMKGLIERMMHNV